ncbi:MAG: hypothetical protein AAF742_03205 [Pseudomonadota bacterium]
MILIRLILIAGGLALTGAIIWALGADDRGLGPVLTEMLSEPWSIVTLIDLYLGFFIVAVIIVLFERTILLGLFWAAPVFLIGNVWAAVWLAIRFRQVMSRLRRL